MHIPEVSTEPRNARDALGERVYCWKLPHVGSSRMLPAAAGVTAVLGAGELAPRWGRGAVPPPGSRAAVCSERSLA